MTLIDGSAAAIYIWQKRVEVQVNRRKIKKKFKTELAFYKKRVYIKESLVMIKLTLETKLMKLIKNFEKSSK